jgi:hypothetical protein
MGWLELGLMGSIVFAAYYFQQIKMTLKEKGHHVDFFTGWISDYKKFKHLIDTEADDRKKAQYQAIVNGLFLSLMGLAVIAVILVKGKFGIS